jgi:putative endonuclease
VEVKTRSTDLFGEPEEAVDTEKVRNLLDAADAYVHQFYLGDIEKRFDIISIVGTNEQNAKVRHIEDAFDVLSGFYK